MFRSFKATMEKSIWNIFEVLKKEINTEDYSVILFFIYLRYQNLISKEIVLSDSEIKLDLIKKIEGTNHKLLIDIADVMIPSIEKVSDKSLSNVLSLLNSVDLDWLEQNITKVFDYTLERITLSQGRISGEYVQPKQLTEFVNTYVGSKKGLKVFNPFAGSASLIKDSIDADLVFAQELNPKAWAVGQLRLFIHESSSSFKCEDSITNWPKHEKFDLIVSNPPYGMRLSGIYREKYPNCRTAEEFLLKAGLDSLSSSGRLIAVLPQGILFRGGSEQRFRKQLINEDLIDTIISFPGGILHHTGISFVVLVLNKAKERPGKIRLVKANNAISKPSSRENIIEVEKLLSLSQQIENTDAVRIITNDDVIANDFNLNIPRYFQEKIEGEKLKDLLTYFRGSRRDIPDTGKMIRIRDLRDDRIDFKLDVSNIEKTELTRPDLRIINESCILLATRWTTLKPTYFEFSGEAIYLNSDILSFKINSQKVDIAYLINELHADYVEEQLTSFRQGASIPMIRRDDLLEVAIKLPSFEEQRAKVAGLQEISEKIKQLQNERNELAHSVSKKDFNEFASLKHTLGRPQQNILGWALNLKDFLKKEVGNDSSLNRKFNDFFGVDIFDALGEIENDIEFISEVMKKGENGLVLNNYEKSVIPLSQINRVIDDQSSSDFKFSITKQLLDVDDMKDKGVEINLVLFQTLLDNLFTNANKYGFKGKSVGNHVMIELSEIDESLILVIKNNGNPFPRNFDKRKFITKYSTADTSKGSGLGGYDINRIAEYFGDENWELILNGDPLYPVIFRFSFSTKLIK